MEGLKRNIVIMDFSGIYQNEQFYEGEQISWIDLCTGRGGKASGGLADRAG